MQKMIKKIAVFCGANLGANPVYAKGAQELAYILVQQNIELIYGGAKVGIMGVIANQMLALGGRVTGVIPQGLIDKEVAHTGLTTQHVVPSMHERKLLIAELADAYIMLPGGMGSLDEFFEVLTMGQLGWHQKPCGILNTANYFSDLIKFMDHCADEGFVRDFHKRMVIVEASPEQLLAKFQSYEPPKDRWSISPLLEVPSV